MCKNRLHKQSRKTWTSRGEGKWKERDMRGMAAKCQPSDWIHAWDQCGIQLNFGLGPLRVARRVPAHGPRVGPADKIAWVPRGNPFRDPRIGDMAGTLAGYPAGNLWVTRRVPAHGPRAGPADKIARVPPHVGIPSGTRVRGMTGPVRDPGLCVGWVFPNFLWALHHPC